jgi:hypothetical protein
MDPLRESNPRRDSYRPFVPCERLILFSETSVNKGDLERTAATVAATFEGFFQESLGAGALVQRHFNVGLRRLRFICFLLSIH